MEELQWEKSSSYSISKFANPWWTRIYFLILLQQKPPYLIWLNSSLASLSIYLLGLVLWVFQFGLCTVHLSSDSVDSARRSGLKLNSRGFKFYKYIQAISKQTSLKMQWLAMVKSSANSIATLKAEWRLRNAVCKLWRECILAELKWWLEISKCKYSRTFNR